MRKFALASFAIFFLSGCATTNTANTPIEFSKPSLTRSQEDMWKLMIGKWYGSQPIRDGGTRKEIVERTPQGNYKIVFRTYGRDGSVTESIETGQWGVSGPVYFTIFRGYNEGQKFSPVDSSDPYNYDAYKIIQLTTELFEYESFASSNRYVLKKVAPDFEFPK